MWLKFGQFIQHSQITQLRFTCSNSTIKTLEKGVKYVSIVDFEQVMFAGKSFMKYQGSGPIFRIGPNVACFLKMELVAPH